MSMVNERSSESRSPAGPPAAADSRFERYATGIGSAMLGHALSLLRSRDLWDLVWESTNRDLPS
jgi:hypothetical protein